MKSPLFNTTTKAVPMNEETIAVQAEAMFSKNEETWKKSYWSVEEPVLFTNMLPSQMDPTKNPIGPSKVVLNTFDSFELAEKWAQRQNKALVIVEIKPAAKVTPTLPVVTKL